MRGVTRARVTCPERVRVKVTAATLPRASEMRGEYPTFAMVVSVGHGDKGESRGFRRGATSGKRTCPDAARCLPEV